MTSSAATLQGTVTSMGDYSTVYVSFEYGLTAGYGTITAEETKTSTGGFSKGISGLSDDTTYHFRARLRYGTTYVYGSDNTFATLVATGEAPGPPTNLYISARTDTSLTLAWARGSGAVNTVVRASTTAYPASPTSGSAVYSGTGITVTHSALTTDTTYYYSAWSESGGVYSVTYAVVHGTPGTTALPLPDVFRIDDVKVYRGFRETNDHLYVIAYRLIYDAGNPIDDVGDYFDFKLMDGTLVRAKVPVASWGYRPGSIYLVASGAPTWGGDYTIRIEGNPAKWGSPAPYVERALTAGDWQGTDLLQLDSWVISTAQSLQSYYDSEMLISSPGGTQVLSDTGAVIFNMGIKGLCVVRPHLCAYMEGYPDVDRRDFDVIEINPAERVGDDVYEGVFVKIADFFNSDANTVGTILFVLGYIVLVIGLAIMLHGVGRSSGLIAMGVASPVLITGAYAGFISFAFLTVLAGIIAAYVFYVIWART